MPSSPTPVDIGALVVLVVLASCGIICAAAPSAAAQDDACPSAAAHQAVNSWSESELSDRLQRLREEMDKRLLEQVEVLQTQINDLKLQTATQKRELQRLSSQRRSRDDAKSLVPSGFKSGVFTAAGSAAGRGALQFTLIKTKKHLEVNGKVAEARGGGGGGFEAPIRMREKLGPGLPSPPSLPP